MINIVNVIFAPESSQQTVVYTKMIATPEM